MTNDESFFNPRRANIVLFLREKTSTYIMNTILKKIVPSLNSGHFLRINLFFFFTLINLFLTTCAKFSLDKIILCCANYHILYKYKYHIIKLIYTKITSL